MVEHKPERGLLSFIKTKLEQSVHPVDIKQMLLRAGFSAEHIDMAFEHARKMHQDIHQDLVAIHNFLPPLSKHNKDFEGSKVGAQRHHSLNTFGRDMTKILNTGDGPVHKGLFVGRLRRKDFVIGFLFFFGIGYIIFAFSALFLAQLAPGLWKIILETIASDTNNYLLMLAPVMLAPITIMSLSLIVRRLHNLELPGGLAFLFLLWFIPSFGQVFEFGFFAIEIALLILFIVLITLKGNPAPNKYGPLPGSQGPFFKRIFNV
jgi:uncharacterized membrane protein YhaH (DUF805 family)